MPIYRDRGDENSKSGSLNYTDETDQGRLVTHLEDLRTRSLKVIA